MPWHLAFFLIERRYFKLQILRVLCHLLQNMYQCYFGVAEDIIRVSAVVLQRDILGQRETAMWTRLGEMHEEAASSAEAAALGALSTKAFILCYSGVSQYNNDSRLISPSSFISSVI